MELKLEMVAMDTPTIINVLLGLLFLLSWTGGGKALPTDGCALKNFITDVQKPYDLAQSERYSYINGVHKLWVYSTDKPFQRGSPTKARTELRFRVKEQDPDITSAGNYISGVWQFEGDMYIPKNTYGVSVWQILAVSGPVTQLRVYNDQPTGVLKRVLSETIGTNIYDRWFHFNVIHDLNKGTIQFFGDGKSMLTIRVDAADGQESYYFKCGVYTQNGASNYMESRWRNLKVWKC